jgi:DNA-binding CsgD family transcriptional regulator
MSLGNLASMARLDLLTLAIGEPNFGDVLVQSTRAVGDVDHIMIFAFSPRRAPASVVNSGAIPPAAAARAAAAYADHLYALDPDLAAIRRQAPGEATWFEFNGGRNRHQAFHDEYLEPCGISDIYSFCACQDGVTYLVQFLRLDGGIFAGAQRWLINQVGEVLAANVCKHFSYKHAIKGQNQFLVGRVLSESPRFRAITPRERLVCIGILTGHTSESIASNLAISVNSVLTYRKRLYEKLEISSQNELFACVITELMSLNAETEPELPAAAIVAGKMDETARRRWLALENALVA